MEIQRILSGLATAFPASVYWILIVSLSGGDYFWKPYFLVSTIFLLISSATGYSMPALAGAGWIRCPTVWILAQGWLSWLAALVLLWAVNLTPLCIGQVNGDGRNDLALCLIQTGLVSIVYLPLEFCLLLLAALPGGWLARQLLKRGGK